MSAKFLSKFFCRRTGLICVEALAVVVMFLIIAGSVLSLRLLSHPLEIEFARPYIQEALRNEDTGVYAKMDRVVLFWPGLREPILIGLQNAAVYGPEGQVIVSIDEAALGLNKARLLIGQFVPEALILKKPSLRLVRNTDNSFDLGLADTSNFGPQAPDKEQAEEDLFERIFGYVGRPGERVPSDAPLAMLKSFEIEDASLLVDDRVLALSWTLPNTDALFTSTGKGLKVDLAVELPSDTDNVPMLKAEALLDWDSKALEVSSVLERFSPALIAQKFPELSVLKDQVAFVDAKLEAVLSSQMEVESASLTALSKQGVLNIADLSAEPVPFSDLGLVAKYDRVQGLFEVSRAQVTLRDVSFEAGATLEVAEGSVKGPVRLDIESLVQESIAPLWPVALEEDNAKEWIVDKLSAGTFSNLYAQGDLELVKGDDGWNAGLPNLVAGFDFEGMNVDYRAPLKAVTNAKGKGSFYLKSETLRIDIEKAQLLDMDVTKADVELINIIEAGKGQADINIELNGPAKSVLTYIKDEPIGAQTDIDVAGTKGRADLKVNVSLPTKNNIAVEDVAVTVKGTLSDMSVPNVVQGLTLSEGPYSLDIADNFLQIKGKGKLEGRPINVEYSDYLISAGKPYSSRVKASLTADPNLRSRFGIDLSAFLDGSAGVDVVYTKYSSGAAEASVSADLTPSRLFVEPFDYEKKPGVRAQTTLKAFLHNDELKEITELKGAAPNLTLESSNLKFRKKGQETELSNGKISRFTIDETVAALEFEILPSGLTKMVLSGPFLDLRPFLDNEDQDKEKPYESPPMQISVAVDRMRTADDETVQYGKLYADIDAEGKFNQLEMDAIAGAGDIYLRYKPDGSGKRVFRLEADDAGATLKAFDLYDNIRGGKLVIYGEPIRGVYDRNLLGVAEISDFKVVDAPALARLLSAMSLPGLMQNLNKEGLSFTKMEANFDWLYRPGGSLLVLKDGRTSGNSLGLTFDGTFDNTARTVDVSGTIIPLSGINKVIGDIPLIGDILTGGTGALIAATYTMKGQSEEPKISVNPLSVLTPGILRRILFENQN